MSEYENSRISHVDPSILEGMVSEDPVEREKAVAELPDALTPVEVSKVGAQIRQLRSPDVPWEGRELERDGLFSLGSIALYEKQDIITAENTAKVLKKRGINGFIGWLTLKHEIRKSKKNIIKSITKEVEEKLKVKCKICSNEFDSPIQLDRLSFETTELVDISYQCPQCKNFCTYNSDDHYFKTQ